LRKKRNPWERKETGSCEGDLGKEKKLVLAREALGKKRKKMACDIQKKNNI